MIGRDKHQGTRRHTRDPHIGGQAGRTQHPAVHADGSFPRPGRVPAGSRRHRRGGMIIIAALLTVFSIFLSYSVFQLQVVDHAAYLEQAADLHLQTVTEYPDRGSLYDRNGTLLARTTYISTVGVTPRDVRPWDEVGDSTPAEMAAYAAGIAAALKMDPAAVLAVLERKVDEKTGKDIEYVVLKKDASKSESDALTAYQTTNKLGGIRVDVETRRYYPLGNLASQVIGLTNMDENTLFGVAGVEAAYNAELAGQPGYKYSETENILGGQLPFSVPTNLQAQDGYSLQLTLDTEIQRITEKAIQQASESSKLPEGAVGIVMDPYTGDILAMAQYPSFDLNAPTACPVGYDPATWDVTVEKNMAYVQSLLWRNRAISDSFEAGSTFKSLTTSMAFDEGLANEKELFSDKEIIVAGWSLHCWSYPSNHGTETLERAMWNSCNPVFVQLSMRVGIQRFYQYIHAFGFGVNTGIDLPAEAPGILHENPTELDMYTMAYGTSATVTPLQLANAYCVLANGGRLMKPTVVRALLNSEGRTVRTTQPQTIRQVISEKTAARVVSMLKGVVTYGTASPGYVEGYTIAAKTGTTTRLSDKKNIASFVAIAPADNPEIVVTVVLYGLDPNQRTIDAGQAVSSIISQTLEYRKVARQYTGDDSYLLKQTTAAPDLSGKTYAEARSILAAARFGSLAGSQDLAETAVIHSQVPAAGTKLHKGAMVVLYADKKAPADPVPIPNFVGLTVNEAARYAAQCGLNILIQGECLGTVSRQEPAAPAAARNETTATAAGAAVGVTPVPGQPADTSRSMPRGGLVTLTFAAPVEGATSSSQVKGGGG